MLASPTPHPVRPTGLLRMNLTEAANVAKLPNYDSDHNVRATLAVEIPLIVLAFATVVLRLWSRLIVKRKLATDDVLITLGLVGSATDKLSGS